MWMCAGRQACQPAAPMSCPQAPSVGIWYGAGRLVLISKYPFSSACTVPRNSHSGSSGALTGTMEVWLQPALDGVILHYFLHAEPSGVAAWPVPMVASPFVRQSGSSTRAPSW